MTQRLAGRRSLLLTLALATLAGCAGPPTAEQRVEVLFEITLPPETPTQATLLLSGSHPALGGESGLELSSEGSPVLKARARLPLGKDISWRLRLRQSSTPDVELDEAGAAVPARTFTVTEGLTVQATLARWGPEAVTAPQVLFLVSVPQGTPSNADIWLSGNHALLGNWNGAGVKLARTVGGQYATRLSFEAGTVLQYKVTRGNWDTVEKDASGQEQANRTHTVGSGFERLSLAVANWADINAIPPVSTVTGNVKYLRDVSSQYLGRARDIIIWLPPDYETNTTGRYPVLYMHDGQNLMDAATSFSGEWKVDETAAELIAAGKVEPLIIVGVYNGGADRIAEYTPVHDPKYESYGIGGKAEDYGRFLVEELKPVIDSTYRTRPEAQYTGLAGSSLGGLVSMYLGLTRSATFTRLGVVSPSVFWGERDIVTRVQALSAKPPLRVWVDIGTEESSNSQETVEDTRLLRDALVGEGWVLDGDLQYTEVPGAQHNEAAWAARFGDVLQYLYPAAP